MFRHQPLGPGEMPAKTAGTKMGHVAVVICVRRVIRERFRSLSAGEMCAKRSIVSTARLALQEFIERRHDFLFNPPTGVRKLASNNSPSRLRSADDNFFTAFTSKTPISSMVTAFFICEPLLEISTSFWK